MELDLPPPYASRPYAGPADHRAMVDALTDYRAHVGNPFTTTLAQFDVQLANVVNCDPARDVAIIEDAAGTVIGFVFTA